MKASIPVVLSTFLLSHTAGALEAFSTQGFFNSGVAWSSTKWPYEDDKWGITNKADFAPLTNLGLMISGRLSKDFTFQSQISSNPISEETPFINDYSFLKFQKFDTFNVSVGRMRNESLLYSAVETKGITHPWVIPPGEVYSISRINHYDGTKISGLYSYNDIDVSLSLIGGSSGKHLSTGSDREHIGILGFLIEAQHPLVSAQVSYTSYRTNDPDIYWNERKESDFTLSVKSEYMGAVFMLEYINHADDDPSEYIARSIDTYNRATILETQANNTTDEAAREVLEDQIIALQDQAELEAAANDFEGYQTTLGYRYLDVFGYLSYASSDGVVQQAWAYHGQQTSISVGASYAMTPNIVVKSQITNATIDSGYKGLFDSPFQNTPILENSSSSSTLDSGAESIYSFAVNVIF